MASFVNWWGNVVKLLLLSLGLAMCGILLEVLGAGSHVCYCYVYLKATGSSLFVLK